MQTVASSLNLSPQLLRALDDLDIPPDGAPDAEGFWLRLAEQLERLEELAPMLPPEIAVEDLAAWLAAGPGGEVLPEGGNPLPLLPGALGGSALASIAALTGEDGSGGLALQLREHLPPDLAIEDLAAWPAVGPGGAALPEDGSAAGFLPGAAAGSALASIAALTGDDGSGGPPLQLREHLLAAALHAVTVGAWRAPAGMPHAGTDGTERGLLELAALQARSADGLQLGQAAAVTPALAETALPQMQAAGGPAIPRMFSLDIPLQQPGWDRALGDRVQWMANQNVQLAELKLNPPGLGPLEVRVRVEGDRTHITFLASQANVREAVDAALPRLREMFAEGGLNLGDVTVGHRDGGEGRGGRQASDRGAVGAAFGEPDAAPGGSPGAAGLRAGQGLVDYYA
jgi:flagellar hook-length control protein FliK